MLSYSLADVGKTITVVELDTVARIQSLGYNRMDTVAGRIQRQTSEYKGWHDGTF